MNWGEYFYYDASTGKLYWAVKRGKVNPGDEAGCLAKTCGYRMVRVAGKLRLVHRIIWEILHPTDTLSKGEEIDHIDHDKLNNKPDNLRKVTHVGNMQNKSKMRNNKTGVTGVFWDKCLSKWLATIHVNGKAKYLGHHADFAKAVIARKDAEVKYNFHSNHGE